MARLIANENVNVHFTSTVANIAAPTVAEITAGTDLTGFLVTLEASTRGNQVPTPAFDSLFETSIPGTVQASFRAEFYRDDTADDAWDLLPRGTEGYFVIDRFDSAVPVSGDTVEVWPVRVISRSALPLTTNDSQRFQVECSVDEEPNEAAVVA